MDFLGIIPSRFGSVRFPGKPLVDLGGKTMIRRVYERASEILEEVFVATDDERIYQEVKSFGGNVVMTSKEHQSGTDRCREAMETINSGTGMDPDVVINIQGDEPFIQDEHIELLKHSFDDPDTQIATLIKRIEDQKEIFDENKPKVVFDQRKFAIYFSRSPIPAIRGRNKEEWLDYHPFYRHIGIYAYRSEILKKITKLSAGDLERAESLEQLRWLENGYKIKIQETMYGPMGIDTEDDLKKARRYFLGE